MRAVLCYAQSLSHVQLFATPWTVAFQATLSMGFSRQEYWSGLPFPSPRDLPNPGVEPIAGRSPALQADSLPAERPGKPHFIYINILNGILNFRLKKISCLLHTVCSMGIGWKWSHRIREREVNGPWTPTSPFADSAIVGTCEPSQCSPSCWYHDAMPPTHSPPLTVLPSPAARGIRPDRRAPLKSLKPVL